MPLLISLFILFACYEIEDSSICTVEVQTSRETFLGQVRYTTEKVQQNCTYGCCEDSCCLSFSSWTIIWIFLLVISGLGFIGCVASAIYYWKCRKPSPQYVIQSISGPMQNQDAMYSPSPMYPGQPYLPQNQPASNPYGYSAQGTSPFSVPQSGAYPLSSPPYDGSLSSQPSQQQPGEYLKVDPPHQGEYPPPYIAVQSPTQPSGTQPPGVQPPDAQPPGAQTPGVQPPGV